MDPIALIADVIATGKITREQRENYREWLDRGGFPARVELHPATDAWQSGDRFGRVVGLGRLNLYVRCDRSARVRLVGPRNIAAVVS